MSPTILMLGAGRMGGALVAGWRASGAVPLTSLLIRDPQPGPAALEAMADGAVLQPDEAAIAEADTVLLAVKPQIWRAAAAEIAGLLRPDTIIVSIAAGVETAALAEAFGGRAVARVMPTTAVAVRQGTASLFSNDLLARERARRLFEPVASVVDLEDEALMHAATAVSGSGPAYVYAFVEALEAAGMAAGLPAEAAAVLARSTVAGAAALMAQVDTAPAELRAQVTSPGGTTQAGLEVLTAPEGLGPLLAKTIAAAARRSRELG